MTTPLLSRMIGHKLNRQEQEKFDRLGPELSAIFIAAGYHDVDRCAGSDKTGNENRRINFLQVETAIPLASMSSSDFMSGTIGELKMLILRQIPIPPTNY